MTHCPLTREGDVDGGLASTVHRFGQEQVLPIDLQQLISEGVSEHPGVT